MENVFPDDELKKRKTSNFVDNKTNLKNYEKNFEMFNYVNDENNNDLNNFKMNKSEKFLPNIQNNLINNILPISTKIRKNILDKTKNSKWLDEIQKSYNELQEKKLLVHTNTDNYSSYFLYDLSSENKSNEINDSRKIDKYERCAVCTLLIG